MEKRPQKQLKTKPMETLLLFGLEGCLRLSNEYELMIWVMAPVCYQLYIKCVFSSFLILSIVLKCFHQLNGCISLNEKKKRKEKANV